MHTSWIVAPVALSPTTLRLPNISTQVPGRNITDAKTNGPYMNFPGEIVSALDHEAFATKYMPDLGYDVKEFQVYHWKLQGWKKLDRKLTSPEFDCGGHKWRMLLFPFGNFDAPPPNETLSVYLNYASPNLEEGWYACAQITLAISNPHDPTIYTACYTYHRFTAKQRYWGFTRFSELRKLFQPQPGHNRPRIEEESAVISAYVRVLEDPTGVLWRNFVDCDSREGTGYIGLKTQGVTGRMNPMLQSLFCTNYFRKAVYQVPTEDQRPTESIPLALQRIFYNLQTSDQPVDTNELTKWFEWETLDSFLQRDVREFNKVLRDELESLMKGTHAEGTVRKLFVGTRKHFIECVDADVDYESSRIEEFNDIELNVKGIETLYDSFRDYVTVKTSKHQVEGFGLEDVRKGTIFRSLPPVLHLQLKRYQYNIHRDTVVKCNDRFEFPFEIDLEEFLDKAADRTKPWKYQLHGVLVHSGGTRGEQYFALIKPDRSARWLKFDDEQVTPVTDQEVLEENYGGGPLNGVSRQTQGNQTKTTGRARMLVYIRETAIDEILAPLTHGDIPPHLKRRLDEERIQMEVQKREREEQRLLLTVRVITDETFSHHEGFDLAAFDKRDSPLSDPPTFRIPKQETYSVFKSKVAQHFGYSESQFRLWALVNRQNGTLRPNAYIPENEPSLTAEAIHKNAVANQRSNLRLYLDILPGPLERIWLGSAGTVMIFLKHFDAIKQSLLGVSKVHLPRVCKMSDLIPIINDRMKWAPGTPLKLYEEVKPGMINLMSLKYTTAQSEIQDGDIICFQVDISDKEIQDLKSRGLCSNPQQFYKVLRNRMVEPDKRE